MDDDWTVLLSGWFPIVKSREAEARSHRTEAFLHIFNTLGGVGDRGGCWAVVPPAGSSVQPPSAVWTDEPQWLPGSRQTNPIQSSDNKKCEAEQQGGREETASGGKFEEKNVIGKERWR